MKKIVASLALVAMASTAQANGRDIAAGVALGVLIATTPRVVAQPPVAYYPPPPPQPVYVPNPNFPQYYPVPRVITSSEPCYYYGQMVMTFDQFNRPFGYRSCQ